MSDISIRIEGRAGRITLQRPKALNALTYDMVLAIEAALDAWRTADIDLILLDAEGDRAFCSGGDIADMYKSGQEGNLDYGRQFWRDEYRLNAKIFEYPKPVVSFLQGFTMGGGVGIGCHGSLRIVGDSSQIAMPECGIGLVPDVGGSLMLALAPGRVGEYLGLTASRMGAADAIFAGFADAYAPEVDWPELKAGMIETGKLPTLETAVPKGSLEDLVPQIDTHFAGETLGDIARSLANDSSDFAHSAFKALNRNAPLAMACSMAIIRRLRSANSIRQALDQEFRYTYRAVAQGDFIEGIRAAIIDRDRAPKWAHAGPESVTEMDVSQMLMPLGGNALNWKEMP
ncbi:3-hydroxyisobutyrate dehydrogenase [Litoreibacter halocynthiae]|uniref:3-hydroxyisobutyryl-CoA hydrolase n=1 Tax=Litoreibacter halocynthiae TaxID=1242689 RepID=A0A4R7LNK0_9RHOB|nr:enoyl-CoA hydratase/isomerase family protein [Litoreibacter halocynthiae]TDT77618.1 3-hydroxyisobutyrate dehydrogenase [Litoreibacter halocynthiae]